MTDFVSHCDMGTKALCEPKENHSASFGINKRSPSHEQCHPFAMMTLSESEFMVVLVPLSCCNGSISAKFVTRCIICTRTKIHGARMMNEDGESENRTF